MKQLAVAILLLRSNPPFSIGKKIPASLGRILVVLMLLFLCVSEVLRVYLVMPFPGSQQTDTVNIAWWISKNILWIRLLTLGVLTVSLVRVFRKGRIWEKILLPVGVAGYIVLFMLFNFRFAADAIFHEPSGKSFMPISESTEKDRLVIGIVVNDEAKAYPIQLIGYHHQVLDTVGNQPVIVTYCTVCRTGRVYNTIINGRHESFRLVGMDHYNAVFEDKSTKSWWQQANGRAIAGPLKGLSLQEIPSQQMTVEAWMRQYPNSLVLEPDPKYYERYFRLENYDRGTMQSPLVKRDQRAWQPKSWVVGVKNEFTSMAYDWNELVKRRVIQDSLRSLPILLAMENDTMSFHVYDRRINGAVLQFNTFAGDNCFIDTNTNSTWNIDGLCIEGPLKGQKLNRVQAYNEFWHSWESFQLNPQKYVGK